MRNVRHLLVAMLVLIGGVSIACTDASAPSNPSDLSPSFSTAGQETTKEEREQRHEQLKLLLNLQKERIKRRRSCARVHTSSPGMTGRSTNRVGKSTRSC